MVKLHGIVIAYEMKTKKQKKSSRREITFKVSKKAIKREDKTSENPNYDSYAEESKFVRKLKKEIERYKVNAI